MSTTWTQKLMDNYGVAWYKFLEGSGDMLVDSKNGFNGSIVNGSTWVDTPYGKGLSFNGSNNYISFNNKVIPLGNKSIRFKIKIPLSDGVTTRVMMDTCDYTPAQKGIQILTIPNGSLYFRMFFGDGDWSQGVSTVMSVCDNSWHDILITYNVDKTLKIYIDDMTTPNAMMVFNKVEPTSYTSNFRIGAASIDSSLKYFNGQLTQIEVYNDIINPIALYHLIKINNNKIKILNSLEIWEDKTSLIADPTNLTQLDYENYGMNSLININSTAIADLKAQGNTTIEILSWTDSTEPQTITINLDDIQSRYALSFDNGMTYHSYLLSSWLKIDPTAINILGMTSTQINALTEKEYNMIGVPTHIKASMKSNDVNITPCISSIQVEAANNKSAIALSSRYYLYEADTAMISGSIKDDLFKVKYRVMLNGLKAYPSGAIFSNYLTTPINFNHEFSYADLDNGNNTVRIEYENENGEQGFVDVVLFKEAINISSMQRPFNRVDEWNLTNTKLSENNEGQLDGVDAEIKKIDFASPTGYIMQNNLSTEINGVYKLKDVIGFETENGYYTITPKIDTSKVGEVTAVTIIDNSISATDKTITQGALLQYESENFKIYANEFDKSQFRIIKNIEINEVK